MIYKAVTIVQLFNYTIIQLYNWVRVRVKKPVSVKRIRLGIYSSVNLLVKFS